jgi:hypothetical protein
MPSVTITGSDVKRVNAARKYAKTGPFGKPTLDGHA